MAHACGYCAGRDGADARDFLQFAAGRVAAVPDLDLTLQLRHQTVPLELLVQDLLSMLVNGVDLNDTFCQAIPIA
jgi:hypothetical protein